MSRFRFTKHASVILRPYFYTAMHSHEDDESLSGYVTGIDGFPFAIAKRVKNKHTYWLIINRFSGRPFVIRFPKKREAERFFDKFSSVYDIKDVDFRNPLSEFNYKIASFNIRRKIKQENYRDKNFKD
jgi:hypothetical protein